MGEIWRQFRRGAFWGLMLIAIIMVGIYGIPGVTGAVFTPTEAAAVASVYSAFVIALFVYRDMGPLSGGERRAKRVSLDAQAFGAGHGLLPRRHPNRRSSMRVSLR